MTQYILVFLYSFLLGTIPTAYLVMLKFHKVDIRQEGSGNVGAMNTYEVSGSKHLGILVFFIDFLKGLSAVYLTSLFYGENFFLMAISMNSVVAGHCFNPWLGFKGGRGLASAAGATALFSPVVILLWGVIWVIGFIFKKNIHFGNIAATVLTGVLIFSSADILIKYTYPPAPTEFKYSIFFGILMLIIVVKHIDPILDWLKLSKRSNSEGRNETN